MVKVTSCPTCKMSSNKAVRVFCELCGAPLWQDPLLDWALINLASIRRLVHHRVSFVPKQTVADLEQLLQNNASLKQACRASLEWLAQDLYALSEDANLLRSLYMAQFYIKLIDRHAATALYAKYDRLSQLYSYLKTTERSWRDATPSAKQAQQWLSNVGLELQLAPSQVHSRVFGDPGTWTAIARAIDEPRFQAAQLQVYLSRCRRALEQKNFEAARAGFEKVLNSDPNCGEAILGLVSVALDTDNLGDAVTWAARLPSLDLGDPILFNRLAWAMTKASESNESELLQALALAERAVELTGLASCWDTLADVLTRLGRSEEALVAARESVRSRPDKADYQERISSLTYFISTSLRDVDDYPLAMDEGEEDVLSDHELRLEPSDTSLRLDANDCFLQDVSNSNENDTAGEDADSLIYLDDFDIAISGASDAYDDDLDSEVDHMLDADEDALMSASISGARHFDTVHSTVKSTDRGSYESLSSTQVPRDDVDCSVYAPPEACVGDEILIQVYVYQPDQEATIRQMAMEFDDAAARRGATALGTKIAHGSTLTFELDFPSLAVYLEPETLTWRGRSNCVQFALAIPANESPRSIVGNLRVSMDTIPIGEIKFKLKLVGQLNYAPPAATGTAIRYRDVFVSYASADRPEVLRRVQMLSAAGIRCFQDILNMEPGERWEERIYTQIDQSDVMFLFWSSNAKQSEWVEREWRYALQKKGVDFVRPVIIEGPPIVPPPKELEQLHFNDRVLYFLDP